MTICPGAPSGTCVDGDASFQVKDKADDAKDQLKWKWKKGNAIAQVDLGDPVATAVYSLCVYDSTATIDSLAASIRVEPNASWVSKDPKGYQYKDKTAARARHNEDQVEDRRLGQAEGAVPGQGRPQSPCRHR